MSKGSLSDFVCLDLWSILEHFQVPKKTNYRGSVPIPRALECSPSSGALSNMSWRSCHPVEKKRLQMCPAL